jgi:hypothetical protein
MSAQNIFEEDWRDCLRAHLFHVLRERDRRNEHSLISVLLQTGFTEDEISALRTQALIALGLYPEEGEEVLTEVMAESAAEPPGKETPAPSAEITPESEPDTQSDIQADAAPHKLPDDEPPAPPVQLSLF